jgi:hypothetical protein
MNMPSSTTTTLDMSGITNGTVTNNEWSGTGVFDKLMYAANKNIEIQFNKGRIVGKEYAEAYTNVMNTIIAQSIQYYLQKDTQDAQTADIISGTLLKEAKAADDLLTSEKQREDIDIGIMLKERQIDSSLLDDRLKEIELNDKLLTSEKQREDIDTGITLKERQLASSILEDRLKETETNDKLLTSEKQRLDARAGIVLKEQQAATQYAEQVKLDKEAAMLGMDTVMAQSKTSKEASTTFVYTPRYVKGS